MQLNKKEIIFVPKNKYKVAVEFMFGDADGGETQNVLVDDTNDELERFLKCLIMCKAVRGSVRNSDEYNRIPDYNRYFTEGEPLYCEHPNDPQCDYQFPSSFDGFEITHFDENGTERKVEHILSRTEKQELTDKLAEAGFKYSNIR